jgi:hypothetical protein
LTALLSLDFWTPFITAEVKGKGKTMDNVQKHNILFEVLPQSLPARKEGQSCHV